MSGCNRDTVWTWNAIGKRKGTRNLAADAEEGNKGFLLNHLISELLPKGKKNRYANADPVTGQAAWFDLRVRIRKAEAGDEISLPQFDTITPLPGLQKAPLILRYGEQFLPKGNWRNKSAQKKGNGGGNGL